MNMPNRSAEVATICNQHPEAFPQNEENDSARLILLRGVIIPTLNKLDNGEWGYVTKTEQNNKVPCDVLMWHDTRQCVDCMTGTGPTWIIIPQETILDTWVWTPVDTIKPVDDFDKLVIQPMIDALNANEANVLSAIATSEAHILNRFEEIRRDVVVIGSQILSRLGVK